MTEKNEIRLVTVNDACLPRQCWAGGVDGGSALGQCLGMLRFGPGMHCYKLWLNYNVKCPANTADAGQMMDYCWTPASDAGPPLNQHWLIIRAINIPLYTMHNTLVVQCCAGDRNPRQGLYAYWAVSCYHKRVFWHINQQHIVVIEWKEQRRPVIPH